MDWLNTAVAALALGISALAFLRTLFLDQVVADLVFEWDATLGVPVGKLMIENPLRHSIYISGICFDEPVRRDIVVRVPGSGLYDDISDAYEEAVSANDRVAVINARIPPIGDMKIELEFPKKSTGLRLRFEWSKAMPWTVKRIPRLIPRSLEYSASDIEVMRRTARRGEPSAKQ